MKTRTVYRYENRSGQGPYLTGTWPEGAEDTQHEMRFAHYGSHHPMWDQDGLEHVSSRYMAATDSREALDAWFDGWQDTLAKNGFHVQPYRVPAENVEDSISGLQVAFKIL